MPKPPPPPTSKPALPKPRSASPPSVRGTAKPPGPIKPSISAPAPSKPPADNLAEVERALSILHGRHPEAVRAERETQAALDTKRASSEAHVARAAKEEKRTWLLRGAIGVALAAAAAFAWSAYAGRAARGKAVENSLAPRMAPYVSLGFSRVSPSRFALEMIELSAEEPTCFVALSSRSPGDGTLRVERPSGPLEGSDSIAWCTCGAERSVASLGTPGSGGGLAVARIAAAELGGDQGLYFLSPRAKVIATPDECSSVSLDAWIDKGHAPVRPDDSRLSPSLRARLGDNGFNAVASAAPEFPFAVVPGVPETCILAWSTAPEDVLSLRLSGGGRAQTEVKGVLGACGEKPKTMTAWRKGTGDLVVEQAPAARMGGIHGLREAAVRLGFARTVTWVSNDDLAWDASSTLRASGVPSPEIAVSTDGSAVPQARVLALSIAGAMVRADGKDDGYSCEPPLTRNSEHAVCVQGTALAWHVVGAVGKAGIAEATLPFWMLAFSNVTDPAALGVELSVLKLGRRLVAEGFEATTLDGVTETRDGALITGRAGDDAIVAIVLTREAPWASPCSAGDPGASSLEAEPVHVPLAPGAQVKLVCGAARGETRDRRTVVFRHPATATAKAPDAR
jgi:hypothetical protein